MEKILVLNAGSTTVKFQLYQMDKENNAIITGGVAERVGQTGSKITVSVKGGEPFSYETPMTNHKEAVQEILNYLTHKYMKNANELAAVAHRMGYGGNYDGSVAIDEKVMQELIPDVLQVAVFDTAFHQSIKKEGYLYALPKEVSKYMNVRRYGFHGPSHRYVTEKAAQYLGYKGRFICCHLGGGASITAVKNGKSVMTSMGYTPLSGIVMSTRTGDIDPYIPLHIMKTQHKTADEVNAMLNKQSGLYGLTNGHADMRDILEAVKNGDKECSTAIDVYIYNIIKSIGAGIACMEGIDALIFTAGIGEKSSYIRHRICEKLAYLGLSLDDKANETSPAPTTISSEESKIKVLVIPTDEELMMAKDAYNVYMAQTGTEREAV